jgi:hypothetical protein
LYIRNGHCAGAHHLVASTDAESISTAPRPRFGHHGQTIVRGDPLFEANPTHLDNSHRAIQSVADELVYHTELGYPRQDRPAGEMAVKPRGIRRHMHLGRKASILAILPSAYDNINPNRTFPLTLMIYSKSWAPHFSITSVHHILSAISG